MQRHEINTLKKSASSWSLNKISKQCISGGIKKENIFVKNRTVGGRMFLASEHM
jgi:hypothetical protein